MVDMPRGSGLLEERFDPNRLIGLCQGQMWRRALWGMGLHLERHLERGRKIQGMLSEVG